MPKKPVGNTFVERSASEASAVQGRLFELPAAGESGAPGASADGAPALYYEHPAGSLMVGDSLAWLDSVEAGSVELVFADPPYNIGKAGWDRFESTDDYIEWSMDWIEKAAATLSDSGSMYICGFSEVLADLRRPATSHFQSCRWLVWSYHNKANLGNGWGRSHESILYLRKGKESTFNIDDVRIPYGRHTLRYPDHPQAESSQYSKGKKGAAGGKGWRPHPEGAKPRDVFELPVTSNGMAEKTPHPTQKPEELVRRFVLASSNQGDIVLDPFVGSGTSLVCAQQLGRRWIGCELDPEFASWAVRRLEQIPERSVREWVEFDRETCERRRSIR